MSAPWEVFVDSKTPFHWYGQNDPMGKLQRYLRADLTCGECALIGKVVSMATGYGCAKPMSGGSSSPACMAFVPKDVDRT